MKEHRIDDLRDPQRTAKEQAIFDFGLDLDVELSPDGIIAAATQATGLSLDPDHAALPRLAAQAAAVDRDDGLSGIGRLIVRNRLIRGLSARLRFDDFVQRNPEALQVELEPPVIVVGLPRSGTTHLVNLLASDSRFRALPWWEIQEPIPVIGDGPGPDGVDPRYARAQDAYELAADSAPLVKLMHDRPPHSIEEECELLDLDFCSYALEWHARVPAWRDHYLGLDQREHYAFLHQELQVLSYLRGPRRWVLKTPQHLEQIPALLATFPDATIAFTLRDPVAVVQSAITMLAYGDRARRTSVEPDALAEYWIDRIERLLRAAVRDTHLIPETQRVDVEFGEFMSDDLAMATRVIETAGMDITPEATAELSDYVAGNPRGKDGRIVYDLKTHFRIDPADLYERYAFYFDEFPQIGREVSA
ncbi:MAG: sulfotransferase [Acidimicrobiales bacterium]|nr:sulfotransferase [Acidimicrobiales bacterium]